MKNYKLFKKSDSYKLNIYDNCSDAIYIKKDGSRLRIESDNIVWSGNTGGYQRSTNYIDGRQNVKLFIKNLRGRTLEAIKCGMRPGHPSVLAGGENFDGNLEMHKDIAARG